MSGAVACLEETQALAFVAGELDASGRGVVEDHVDDCAQCRQLIAELVRKHRTTDRRPGTEDTVAAPALSTGDTHLATDKDPTPPPSEQEAKAGWTPGARVGRYVVLARIGRGGMGTVFRAEDVELGRPVALKRLHANADDDSRKRLIREAQSAAQLSHPERRHACTRSRRTMRPPFVAMELVDGVTLATWLA